MRLAKYLARAGVASRRRAERMISEGRVMVNSITADKPQLDVGEEDLVMVDGREVTGSENKEYLLLNKPPGYISTAHDTHGRPTVTGLIDGTEARLYPVGRLDADTSGALLLTNDGELAYRLTHPRYQVKKVYRALVYGQPGNETLDLLRSGLVIDGEKTAPASVRVLKTALNRNETLLEIVLTEGKKRQVKKMCAAVGHPVKNLHRESFAGLNADKLSEGSWRSLNREEIDALYRIAGL
jgi:23S rRNA pseudouridine2605 synthase